jgi:hypothetical protein
VLSLFEETRDLTDEQAEHAARSVLWFCGGRLHCCFRLDASRQTIDEVLERAQACDAARPRGSESSQREWASLMSNVHNFYALAALRFDRELAVEHAREAERLASESGDEGLRIDAARGLVTVLRISEHWREAWEIAERELEHAPADPLIKPEFLPGQAAGFPILVTQGALALAYLGQPLKALGLLADAVGMARRDHQRISPDQLGDVPRLILSRGPRTRAEAWAAGHAVAFASEAYYFAGDAEQAATFAQANLDLVRGVLAGDVPLIYAKLARAFRLGGQWDEFARVADLIEKELGSQSRWFLVFESELRALIAEGRARLGDRRRAIDEVSAIASTPVFPGTYPHFLDTCARALLHAGGSEQKEPIEALFQRLDQAIHRTGATSFSPFLHELRAGLALVCGDGDTCKRERREAERLWTEMGAPGHIERMTRELEELAP